MSIRIEKFGVSRSSIKSGCCFSYSIVHVVVVWAVAKCVMSVLKKIVTSSGRSTPHPLLYLGFPVGPCRRRTLPYSIFCWFAGTSHASFQLATKFSQAHEKDKIFLVCCLIYGVKMVLGKSTVPLITVRKNWPFDLVFTGDNRQLAAPTFQVNVASQAYITRFPQGTGAFILLDVE